MIANRVSVSDTPIPQYITERDLLSAKASSPISFRLEGNVSFCNEPQPLKALAPIVSTPSGITRVVRFLLLVKAEAAIAVTFLPSVLGT